MGYVPTQSPWLAAGNTANDLGATFGNFMINMARLRAEQALQDRNAMLQARHYQMQNELGQQRLKQQGELDRSTIGLREAQAGFNKERTAALQAGTQRGVDTGAAAFANTLTRLLPKALPLGNSPSGTDLGMGGYNPFGTSLLPATPEVLQALTKALTAQGTMGSVATSPAASASVAKEFNIPRGGTVFNPLSDLPVGLGQEIPQPGFTLRQGEQRRDAKGNIIAEMPVDESGNLLKLLTVLPNIIGHGNSTIEGLDRAMVPNYEQGKIYGDTTNNMAQASALLSALLPQAQAKYGGMTNAPSAQTGPKVGDILKGYRFLGGDPAKKESWEKVQ